MSFEQAFNQFPILETERLILRQLQADDASELYAYYSDPDVYQYLDWHGPNSVEDAAKRVISNWNRWYAEQRIIRWGIVLKVTQRLIGTIFLCDFVGESRADVGYELAKAHWNQGIMTEALRGVLSFGFETMRLHRIQAIVNPENPASLTVLKKAGFEEEGLLRAYEYHYIRRDFNDVIMLALLRRDYQR